MYLFVLQDIAHVDPVGEYDVAVVAYTRDHKVTGFFWFYFVGLVWMEEYILAAQQFVVAGAVGIWYFVR